MNESNETMLSIVPTPIGNIGDMTPRAVTVLQNVDIIFCEDTRVTRKLLGLLGIKENCPQLRCLDENMLARDGAKAVINEIESGKNIAYCSDAGMPGISDPGMRLVAAARDSGIAIEVLPGACAASTAFVASGTNATNYYFGGFLPRKTGECKTLLEKLAPLDAALIFYESPKRIVASLKTIAAVFPYREVTVCRELTKLHEEVVSGNAPEIMQQFADREREAEIRGEIAIVIDPATSIELEQDYEASLKQARALAVKLARTDSLTDREIAQILQDAFTLSRNEAKAIALDTKVQCDDFEIDANNEHTDSATSR